MSRRCPRGLTLIELLIAVAIIAMVVGTLGALGSGVHSSYEYTEGHGTVTQHARVALDRIARMVNEATANEQFPGFLVLAESDGPWRFPDTLVVWHPAGSPADAEGLPRFNELVIYCPHPSTPSALVEMTVPGDTRVVPPATDTSAWNAEIAAIKQNANTRRTTLTPLLRSCAVTTETSPRWRGAVRFEQRLRPTDAQYAQYKAGSLAWAALDWPQGIVGSQTGMRQAWLRCEIQLLPGTDWAVSDPAGQRAVPFFGSAAVYFDLKR